MDMRDEGVGAWLIDEFRTDEREVGGLMRVG